MHGDCTGGEFEPAENCSETRKALPETRPSPVDPYGLPAATQVVRPAELRRVTSALRFSTTRLIGFLRLMPLVSAPQVAGGGPLLTVGFTGKSAMTFVPAARARLNRLRSRRKQWATDDYVDAESPRQSRTAIWFFLGKEATRKPCQYALPGTRASVAAALHSPSTRPRTPFLPPNRADRALSLAGLPVP